MSTVPIDERLDAAADLLDEVNAFIERYQSERIALFQQSIRCTVTRTSPLLVDFAASLGVDLVSCISGMQPTVGWPAKPRAPGWSLAREPLLRRAGAKRGRRATEDLSFSTRFSQAGVVIRLPSNPHGCFGIRAAGDRLEACFDVGPLRFLVGAGPGRVMLPPGMPETVLGALVGRNVECLIDHDLVKGRGYSVRRVGRSLPSGGAPILFLKDDEVEIDLLTGWPCR